jgi:hypothetical protein
LWILPILPGTTVDKQALRQGLCLRHKVGHG